MASFRKASPKEPMVLV